MVVARDICSRPPHSFILRLYELPNQVCDNLEISIFGQICFDSHLLISMQNLRGIIYWKINFRLLITNIHIFINITQKSRTKSKDYKPFFGSHRKLLHPKKHFPAHFIGVTAASPFSRPRFRGDEARSLTLAANREFIRLARAPRNIRRSISFSPPV